MPRVCSQRAEGLLLHHPEHHRAEVGDQPHDPDKDAELVEVQNHLLILADQDHGGIDHSLQN